MMLSINAHCVFNFHIVWINYLITQVLCLTVTIFGAFTTFDQSVLRDSVWVVFVKPAFSYSKVLEQDF